MRRKYRHLLMKFKFFFILFFLLSIFLYSQSVSQLGIVTNNGTKYIPVYDREGTIYFAIKHFADALSLDYNYNPETGKIEVDLPKAKLFVTAQNPYLILLSKEDETYKTYQVPTSSYLLNGNIYLPLKYSLGFLNQSFEGSVKFEEPDKLIVPISVNEKTSGSIVSTNSDYDITGISLDEKANGTLVRVKSDKRILSYNSSFKDGILTIIFRNVNVDASKINKHNGEGLIKDIDVANVGNDAVFKFSLRKEYTASEVLNVENSNDILIALHNKIFENKVQKTKEKKKWEFNVVVIDPGHGGKDSGTIGIDGIEEKNITLAIGLKLGKILHEKMKDLKVVFTRTTDKFVELYKRGQIANEANGNLFISIHCNATPHKPSDINGFEVYLLRPGRTKEAISIAEKENSVISYEDNPARYQKLTDENFILVSMAQSAYMRYSEKFASILNQEFSKDISIQSRGVKQAGFYVLVGASMPSVLIETGFLSNRHDAHYLNSSRGQTKIAEAIYEAIKKFKEQYEKSFDSE
jgi:N-acetylmuramoyl-L-alanine amidase